MFSCFLFLYFAESFEEAYTLIQDLEPSSPQEYILKAVANTVIGQERGSVSFVVT